MKVELAGPDYEFRALVYYCYDEGGVVIYVGRTCEFDRRLGQHRYKTEWWAEVTRVSATDLMPWDEAVNLERRTILEMSPRYNRQRYPANYQGALNRPQVTPPSARAV